MYKKNEMHSTKQRERERDRTIDKNKPGDQPTVDIYNIIYLRHNNMYTRDINKIFVRGE